jgi:hypothetical protein
MVSVEVFDIVIQATGIISNNGDPIGFLIKMNTF